LVYAGLPRIGGPRRRSSVGRLGQHEEINARPQITLNSDDQGLCAGIVRAISSKDTLAQKLAAGESSEVVQCDISDGGGIGIGKLFGSELWRSSMDRNSISSRARIFFGSFFQMTSAWALLINGRLRRSLERPLSPDLRLNTPANAKTTNKNPALQIAMKTIRSKDTPSEVSWQKAQP
jgi:hypothetical protein